MDRADAEMVVADSGSAERTAPLAALAPNMNVGIQISTERGSENCQRHPPFGSCLSERAPLSETPKRRLAAVRGGRRLTRTTVEKRSTQTGSIAEAHRKQRTY